MSDPSRPTGKAAFTITELLTVIAIIAVLISILIPALGKARELGRRTKCMANQRTLAQAVQAFAVEHQGFGQILGGPETNRVYGAFSNRYKYEVWPWLFEGPSEQGDTQTIPSPWPIAYADYLGVPGLKSVEFFTRQYPPVPAPRRSRGTADATPDLQWPKDMRKIDVLRCPSDRDLAGDIWAPTTHTYCAVSYRINRDLFDHHYPRSADPSRGVWRNGVRGRGTPLAGRLDGVIRPSEVVMFADSLGGGAWLTFNSADGPSWSDYQPHPDQTWRRHGADNGAVAVHVDGHAEYLRPLRWSVRPRAPGSPDNVIARVPVAWSPNPRITPYEPDAPSLRGGQRQR